MPERRTHFEQISVESVKNIAHEFPADDQTEIHSLDSAVAPQETWRELAQKVQVETHPDKMLELVQQLIEKFDREKQQLARPLNHERE